jgi:MFS family permease
VRRQFIAPPPTAVAPVAALEIALFGVSLTEAGLLLAANRLVRIAGYGWVARFYARRGPRAACLFAAVGSVLATFGYALLSGVWWLVIARLIWGLSFAAMNIATQVLATAKPAGASRRSGRMRAVIAAGSVGGLLGGAAVSPGRGPARVFPCAGLRGLDRHQVRGPAAGRRRKAR